MGGGVRVGAVVPRWTLAAMTAGVLVLAGCSGSTQVRSRTSETSASTSGYIDKPRAWRGGVQSHGLIAALDDRPVAVVRLGDDRGGRLGVATIDPVKRTAEPIGSPFGLDGRELFPEALLPLPDGPQVIALACDRGSDDPDSCSNGSVERFTLGSDRQWRHQGPVDLHGFVVSSWPVVSAAAVDQRVVVAVSNVEPAAGDANRSTTVVIDTDGSTSALGSSLDAIDATCASGGSVVQLTRTSTDQQATVKPVIGPGEPVVLTGSGWRMACDPVIAWFPTEAVQPPTTSPIGLPSGTHPVDAAGGVVIAADQAGTTVTLVQTATGSTVARYKLAARFGATSVYANTSGTIAAMDVAPPDTSHLPVWTRTR